LIPATQKIILLAEIISSARFGEIIRSTITQTKNRRVNNMVFNDQTETETSRTKVEVELALEEQKILNIYGEQSLDGSGAVL
jgi:hypothetical protein